MGSESPVVFIVLSTFNGERFLREQLDSLLSQTHQNISILVRDDGSRDTTRELLREYSKLNGNINVWFEENVGVVGSFLQLLRLVPSSADYVALCDQDDVWSEGKIERALSVLNTVDATTPLLYCSAAEIVNEELMHIQVEMSSNRPAALENALAQNIAIGCTIVINRAALQLVQRKNVDVSKVLMHDWWLYQVVSALGIVYYDESSKIKYRQHSANVIGVSSGFRLWANRIKRQLGPNNRAIRRQATELLRMYGSDMEAHNYRLVDEFLEKSNEKKLLGRIVYAFRTPVYRQRRVDNVIFRLLIVFARI